MEKLTSAGIVKAPINIQALLSVDRRNYVNNEDAAYTDSPQPIGYGATISAPHMHAHVLEDLLPPLIRASKKYPLRPLSILDVGCGSGYLTAVFGRMVEPKTNRKTSLLNTLNEGKVYGIDVIPQLVKLSQTNIAKQDVDLLDSSTVHLRTRDGWKGYPEGAPYHAIHVGAAAASFPKELMMQLAVGGVMVVPVGPDGGTQYLYMVERVGDDGVVVGLNLNGDDGDEMGSSRKGVFREEDYKVQKVLGVRYVPLVRSD